MSRYHETQRDEDQLSLANALQYLDQISENFGDVLAIPEVITIQDVMAIALDTTKGPQLIGDVCSRDEIVHILRAFVDNPCGDPALIAQYALNDYRETQQPTNKE
jgi:hypothetical protein